jgi:signal transduction histidine kinase
VCGADDVNIRLVEGNVLRRVAHQGSIPIFQVSELPIARGSVTGRAVVDRQLFHIDDLMAVAATEFPQAQASAEREGIRTVLATPLLREGVPIGVILIRRTEVRPFTNKQIALLKTFADQAVIAIENVRLFHEIEEKNQQLEDANRHKTEFLSRVSHDLRTPLNAIIGFTRLVLRKADQLPDLQRQNLQKVLISSEHLLNLINSLLDLAKIEAGKMDIIAESFRVEDIINLATATVEPLLRDGRVRIITEIAPGISPITSDRDKLKQILLNLLGNAAKFTEQGEIRVAASQENGALKLAVADTGIGMTKESLAHIFDEFRQAEKSTSSKYGGTGLGLAIVKKLTNLLGGEIAVESEEGKGSRFTITLPLGIKG